MEEFGLGSVEMLKGLSPFPGFAFERRLRLYRPSEGECVRLMQSNRSRIDTHQYG